jgi:ankyrin repeat protein
VAGDLTDDELAFLAGVFDLARDGRHEELSGLVDQGVPVNLTNGSGDTLLILAAYHDHPATVRVLLERGADSRRVNDRGQTALGAAVFRRSVPSVQLLLASGADPDAGGRSARQISAFFDLPEMAALLGQVPATPREGADHD